MVMRALKLLIVLALGLIISLPGLAMSLGRSNLMMFLVVSLMALQYHSQLTMLGLHGDTNEPQWILGRVRQHFLQN